DFVWGHTLSGEAELLMCVVDERPRSLRDLWHRLRQKMTQIVSQRDANDLEAERAWRIMREQMGGTSPESITQYLHKRFIQDHLRQFEYPFLARCLAHPDLPWNVIVDMGGGTSYSTVVPMLFNFPGVQI